MTYRTVMVGLDGTPTCAARTEVAIQATRDFNAGAWLWCFQTCFRSAT